MDKSNQKKKRHNVLVIKKLAEQFGYSERYIRGCMNNEHDGIMPDEIKKNYKTMETAINRAVKESQTIKK